VVLSGTASAEAPGKGPAPSPGRRFAAGLGALVLAAAVFVIPHPTEAVEAPDAAQLPRLAARCDSAGLTRIRTRRSTRIARRLRIEADAVVLLGPSRAAIIEVGPRAPDLDRRIPWAEVESLSLGRSHLREGALAGVLVGAALGGALVARSGPDAFQTGDNFNVGVAVVGTLAFGVLGAAIGAAHPHWTPLYP